MYFEAIAIAAELRDYPGGGQALATAIMPTLEGMRIIRWPADRIDTLGGYLAYHNITLFTYFLGIFAAIQGARLIRHLEDARTVNAFLAAGVSRNRLIYLRTIAFVAYQLIISLGLGIGTALALAASDESNTSGAIVTLLAAVICTLPFFGLGLLLSQFITSTRSAAGVASIVVTIIYILGNISEKYDWLNWFSHISPFYYANLTRPVIPGLSSNYYSWLMMTVVLVLLVIISALIFQERDIGSVVNTGIMRISSRNKANHEKFVPKSLIGDILWRQRFGLAAWTITTTAFIGLFISMMSGIVDIWSNFDFLSQFTAAGFGTTPEQQYLAMVYEILPPFLAGFIINQSSKWTLDLQQARVQLFLSTPKSWSRLIFDRAIATYIGGFIILIFSIVAVVIGSALQNKSLYPAAMGRAFVMMILFIIAFTSLIALIVSILHGRNAIQATSIYVGAAWLIVFMAPYLKWPTWLLNFSIFDLVGHPYVEWPDGYKLLILGMMTIPTLFLAMRIAERTSKVI